MRQSGISGPVFISIGDEEKLKLFLEKNPNADPNLFLVDDYTFTAYNTIGFGKLLENKDNTIKGSKNLKAPKFSFRRWRDYFSSVAKLSPIPKDFKFFQRGSKIPEGVTRLGGTIALNKNNVVYVYEDGVPGDYPSPVDVLNTLETRI